MIVGGFWPTRLARYAPGQFVALLAGSAAGIIWFTGAPVIGEVPRGLPALTWPVFNPEIIPSAFTMALLCTAVTLLTCLQADATTGGRHQPNRELMAQGVGNIAAGLIGGNPGGASSTTFLNLQAGGRSKVAGVTSAVVVALALAGRSTRSRCPCWRASSWSRARYNWGISSATFLVLWTNSVSSRLSNSSSVLRTRGLLSCIVPELSRKPSGSAVLTSVRMRPSQQSADSCTSASPTLS